MPVATRHQQPVLELDPPTASETTSAILAYLTLQGFAVWRQNNSGIYDPKTTHYRFTRRTAKLTPRAAAASPGSSASASATAFLSASKSKPAATSSAPSRSSF